MSSLLNQGVLPPAPGNFLFTSESVNEGHPDKICDLVSDAVLDACLAQDPDAKVACETCTKTGMIMIFGEITTTAKVNYEQVVRDTVKDIGYDDQAKGLDYKTMNVIVAIEGQSPDIAQGVHEGRSLVDVGAGDQGHMFGYASDESPELMPWTHSIATQLGRRLTEARKDGTMPYLRPDGKTQVTLEYKNINGHMEPVRCHTILISTQHSPDVEFEKLKADLKTHIIEKVVPKNLLDKDTVYHLNPNGKWSIGGPQGDAGLTGRKIIVDTYGGWGAHGGGAFSGKDSTKVDRSAAYGARWVAKSLVAAKLCKRVLFQVSYAIGVSHPLSMHLDTFGTVVDGYTDADLLEIVSSAFDFRPGMLLQELGLRKPIFKKTAAYSHFGRDPAEFAWERPKDLTAYLKK